MTTFNINSAETLSNGIKIPTLGFGVWDSPKDVTTKSCLEAFKVGYRHIDTAQGYGNETEVGVAIQQSGIPRNEIFVTTKIFNHGGDAASTRKKLEESIRKCGGGEEGGYVDSFLIHNVTNGYAAIKEMWLELEKLYKEGKIKSIGVSNFGIAHIEGMKEYASVWPPMVNQLELHPWLQQTEIVNYCRQNNICLTAYCPIVRNQKAEDATLNSIADKLSKTTTQVLLRWSLQKGFVPLPKSDNPKRILNNATLYDFNLDEDDMVKLNDVPQEKALCFVADNTATK